MIAKVIGRFLVWLAVAGVLHFVFAAPTWAAVSVGWILSYLAIPERAP